VRKLLAILAIVACSAARAGEPADQTAAAAKLPWNWELDAYAGYGQLAYPGMDPSSLVWSNGGPAFALTVAYRGDHFAHPFVDVAYVPILSSGQFLNVVVPGGGLTTIQSTNSSYALGLSLGIGLDFDWFRLRGGLSLYNVAVSTNVTGSVNTVSQMSLGFLVGASAFVWRPDPFAIGVEARMALLNYPLTGIYQAMWSVGLTGRWDFAGNR